MSVAAAEFERKRQLANRLDREHHAKGMMPRKAAPRTVAADIRAPTPASRDAYRLWVLEQARLHVESAAPRAPKSERTAEESADLRAAEILTARFGEPEQASTEGQFDEGKHSHVHTADPRASQILEARFGPRRLA